MQVIEIQAQHVQRAPHASTPSPLLWNPSGASKLHRHRWDCYLLTCKVHWHSRQATKQAARQPDSQPASQAAATSITTTSNRANPKATTTVTVQTQLQDSTQLTSKQGDNIQLETSHIPLSCQGARPSCQPGSPPARLSACPCDLTVPPGSSHILLQHPQHLSSSWRLLHRLFVCNTVHSDSWQLPKNLPWNCRAQGLGRQSLHRSFSLPAWHCGKWKLKCIFI